MPDKLNEIYTKWMDSKGGQVTSYEIFQAGFTAGAVAMRERAVSAAQHHKDQNESINAIGSLPDIPA